MTLTIRLIKLFLFSSTVLGSSISVFKSYEVLKNRSEPTHATPHINNLIRNGLGQLNKDERDKLAYLFHLYLIDPNRSLSDY